MKVEFLDDITEGGKYPWADPDKLIRLFDFDDVQLAKLKQEIQINLINENKELVISSLHFVQPLNCSLTFRLSDKDLGIKFPPDDANSFLGQFSKSCYINMLDIIGRLDNGYNWLYDPTDEQQIDLLLSAGGGW